MAPYQATTELDDELIISIRCGGGGKHGKHAGQWVPRTRVEEPCSTDVLVEEVKCTLDIIRAEEKSILHY